jgi:hypothetical protein
MHIHTLQKGIYRLGVLSASALFMTFRGNCETRRERRVAERAEMPNVICSILIRYAKRDSQFISNVLYG